MAKRNLTALSTNTENSTFSNSNTSELSVMVQVDKIKLDDNFKALFPADEKRIEVIAEDMKTNGFDKSQVLHLWKKTDGTMILIDGHTRLAAAKIAGLYDVPVFIHNFETEEEARQYAIGLQVKRRNLSSEEILIAVEMFDSIKVPGRKASDQEGTGKSSIKLAEMLGIGTRTVEKARTVLRDADEETKEKIKNHEKTVNQAYEELPEVKARKGSKKKESIEDDFDEDELSDALEDNSGNPSPVIIHERKVNTSGRNSPLSEEEDNERTRERKEAYELGVKDCTEQMEKKYAHLFETALYWTLAQMLKGKTAKDIYNDPAVSDLSFSVISNFELSKEDDDLVYKLSQEK